MSSCGHCPWLLCAPCPCPCPGQAAPRREQGPAHTGARATSLPGLWKVKGVSPERESPTRPVRRGNRPATPALLHQPALCGGETGSPARRARSPRSGPRCAGPTVGVEVTLWSRGIPGSPRGTGRSECRGRGDASRAGGKARGPGTVASGSWHGAHPAPLCLGRARPAGIRPAGLLWQSAPAAWLVALLPSHAQSWHAGTAWPPLAWLAELEVAVDSSGLPAGASSSQTVGSPAAGLPWPQGEATLREPQVRPLPWPGSSPWGRAQRTLPEWTAPVPQAQAPGLSPAPSLLLQEQGAPSDF